MEYKKRLQVIIICLFLSSISYSQNKFVVYQIEGEMYLIESEKDLHVGSLINSGNQVVNLNGTAILLDENSNTYQISERGNITFNKIKGNKKAIESKSVSKRYLSYVYKKFLNLEKQEVVYGGVFRGNKILDSPESYAYFKKNSFINFKWKNTGVKTYYLWIFNLKNNKLITKIKVDANELGLLLPLNKGLYKWTVTKENDVDNEKHFNILEIVSKKEFEKRKNDSLYEAKMKASLILNN